jgi:hypothetical protein
MNSTFVKACLKSTHSQDKSRPRLARIKNSRTVPDWSLNQQQNLSALLTAVGFVEQM